MIVENGVRGETYSVIGASINWIAKELANVAWVSNDQCSRRLTPRKQCTLQWTQDGG